MPQMYFFNLFCLYISFIFIGFISLFISLSTLFLIFLWLQDDVHTWLGACWDVIPVSYGVIIHFGFRACTELHTFLGAVLKHTGCSVMEIELFLGPMRSHSMWGRTYVWYYDSPHQVSFLWTPYLFYFYCMIIKSVI